MTNLEHFLFTKIKEGLEITVVDMAGREIPDGMDAAKRSASDWWALAYHDGHETALRELKFALFRQYGIDLDKLDLVSPPELAPGQEVFQNIIDSLPKDPRNQRVTIPRPLLDSGPNYNTAEEAQAAMQQVVDTIKADPNIPSLGE